jgi:uncharacterized protein (DUF849 family)
MLLKAAINGRRTRNEHPLVPITPCQQANDAACAVREGAGAIHVHPRDGNGGESLAPDDVAAITAIFEDLDIPRFLHGCEALAWEFIALAGEACYDTRIGLEDTLTLPDGSRARDNGELVSAARKILSRQP